MSRFVYLRERVLNVDEIESVDDRIYDRVTVRFKSGRRLSLDEKDFGELLKALTPQGVK